MEKVCLEQRFLNRGACFNFQCLSRQFESLLHPSSSYLPDMLSSEWIAILPEMLNIHYCSKRFVTALICY